MKAFTCAKTKEINAQLQVENSFFPRFGRSRNSECFSSKPTTNPVSSTNVTSKLTQSTKFGNTVESILDATYNNDHENHENGHNGIFLDSVNSQVEIDGEDEPVELRDDQEMESKQNDNSICIINSNSASQAGARSVGVLHTDL